MWRISQNGSFSTGTIQTANLWKPIEWRIAMSKFVSRMTRRQAVCIAAASGLMLGALPLSRARAASWTQTSASGIGDVAVGPDNKIWLAGRQGSIWSGDGQQFA